MGASGVGAGGVAGRRRRCRAGRGGTRPARRASRVPSRPDVRSGPRPRIATTGEGTVELGIDALAVVADDRELFAVNMVVVGTAPDRAGWFSGAPDLRVEVDGRAVHDGPATSVVVASGQYLRGHDVVPRGHPGDGRAEVQVYAVPRGQRAGVRSRLPQGVHLPHPDITQTSGRRVTVVADKRPVGLEVDGVPGPPATADHRRDRPRGVPDRRLTTTLRGPRRGGGTDTIASPDGDLRLRWSRRVGGETVGVYPSENFTDDEAAVLRPYFTNLDRPVFALVNLPEVVKGALFARYSRTHKSLRRLFLDEFVNDLDLTGDLTVDATVGLKRAEELYDRVFLEYGDDSVAQLGGVHLACEQASNLLTKILEWGRLMAYLEQSTRYIEYDQKLDGRYRYYRDRDVLASRRARVALHRRHGRAVHHVRRAAARRSSSGHASATRRNRATPTSSTSRRSRRRRATRSAASCPRRRCRTSASTAPARVTRRCCCACARTRSPRRAATRR